MELADEFRNTQWETLRGVWWPDTNREMGFVKAPIEEVGNALANSGYHWQKDVLGKRVVIAEGSLIVYQLRGHSWSCIVAETFLGVEGTGLATVLSRQLKTTTIHYAIGKTAGVRYYTLYQNGKVMEDFTDLEGETHLNSKLRQVGRKIRNSRQFSDKFLRSQDALDSGIAFEFFFRTDNGHVGTWNKGKAKKIQNLGMRACYYDGDAVTRPPIERVDFLTPPGS